jgi:hypothetical protein
VAKVGFDVLLASCTEGDIEKLQARKAALESEKVKAQDKLTKLNGELQEIETQISAPIKNAVKAALLLGVEVPEQYRSVKVNGVPGTRSLGKFYWEAKAQTPFQSETSRAMWRLSQGSGGSAGKNGEGVLTAEEFWTLAKLDESSVRVGDKHTVTLPNGKEVTFQRME